MAKQGFPDVFQRAGARDLSDQPTTIKSGQSFTEERPYDLAKAGEVELLDPEQLALMTKDKVRDYWHKGIHASTQEEALKYFTEAMEQLSKQGKMAQELSAGYAKHFRVQGLDPKIQKGLEIINTRELSPLARQENLIQLGFRGGVEEFSEKLAANIHSLKIAPTR